MGEPLVEAPRDDRDSVPRRAELARTVADIAELLRMLRRRRARENHEPVLTYREMARKTGWSLAAIGDYLAGKSLPPTDRLDALVRLLGASPREAGVLATARDRVEENSRRPATPPAQPLRQLPADVPAFVGRTAEVAALDSLGPIVVISGTAGVGKTALAVHWAHRAADRFPDGQLYLDLRGFSPAGPTLSAAEGVRVLLDSLGVPVPALPTTPEAQAALYRSLLADRRLLIVLDNAYEPEQVRPLLPGAGASVVLVTSRNQLTGLVAAEGAECVRVAPLTFAEAGELLAARLGAKRVAAEPEAVAEIVVRCASLPLALAVVAARARTRPQFALERIASALRDDTAVALSGGDPATNLWTAFSWSYDGLSPPAARLFRLLGVHPGPLVSPAAAASLLGVPPTDVTAPLAELTEAHLVDEPEPGRYGLHDLLRAYARTLADDAEHRGAVRRLLDHYTRSSYTARVNWHLPMDTVTLPAPAPGVRPEVVTKADAAAWFARERPVLLACVELAERTNHLGYVWPLAWTLHYVLDRHLHWDDWIRTQSAALRSTRATGDADGQANAHRFLGDALVCAGRYAEAHQHLSRALELSARLGHDVGQGMTRHSLSLLAGHLGEPEQAMAHKQEALALFRRAGFTRGEAGELNGIGWQLAQQGRLDEALALCEEALARIDPVVDPTRAADTWDSLGYIHDRLGQPRRAVECYTAALEIFRVLADWSGEADVLMHLGDLWHTAGEIEAARRSWERALRLVDGYHGGLAGELRSRLAEH